MLPYFLVLALVLFWILFERKVFNRIAFWVPLIILSLFAGMRSYHVGTDSGTYTRDFRTSLNVYNFQFNEFVEPGYQLLEYNLLKLTHNYFWLFLITALIVVYCYLIIIKKYSVNYWFSVFLFLTSGVYTFFFNGLRQGLAMAVFALAIPYLLEKRFFIYFVVCVVASLFHTTALFMVPFYFLVNFKIKLIYKVMITFLGSLFTVRFLIAYIAGENERYKGYAQVSESAGGFLTLGFYTLISFFIFFVIYIYKIKDEQLLKLFTFYTVGVFFIIPIAMLGANPSGPQRLLSYFTWTIVLMLPIVFKRINNIYMTSISVFVFVIYFILATSKFSNLTPYVINPIFKVF